MYFTYRSSGQFFLSHVAVAGAKFQSKGWGQGNAEEKMGRMMPVEKLKLGTKTADELVAVSLLLHF